ncbi:MAG TPA: hypothetical protein VF749_04620, partial [Candidatus Acidoferrum sp.]
SASCGDRLDQPFNSDSNRCFSLQGLAACFKFFVPVSVLLFESGDHIIDEAARLELIPQSIIRTRSRRST